MANWYTCSDCDYMNLHDTNRHNEAYCHYYKRYYNINDKACQNAKVKGKEIGRDCYLTTAICDILKQNDNGYVLETLRNFRDSYIKSHDQYAQLLKEYDEIGPKICQKLNEDEYKKIIANAMLYFRIYPAIEKIKQHNYKNAIIIYKDMTEILKEMYNVNSNKKKEIDTSIIKIKNR